MDLVTLLLLAVGLSMDAFAVSVSSGILMCHTKWTKSVKLAGAFGLLVFIGGKMLWEVLRGGDGDDIPKGDPTDWKNLLVMAIATSIDAMAVGVTMALAGRTGLLAPQYGFLLCCLVIALVTFVLCLAGVQIGCRTGDKYGKKAEIAGGIVLIGIGVKILLEHLLGF